MFTKKLEKELFLDAMMFIIGTVLISFFYADNNLLTILMIFVFSVGFKFWYKKHDSYFFVAGATLGSAGEIVAIYFGAWQYANPTFLGIPIWLPLAWGLGVVFMKRVAEIFVKIEMK